MRVFVKPTLVYRDTLYIPESKRRQERAKSEREREEKKKGERRKIFESYVDTDKKSRLEKWRNVRREIMVALAAADGVAGGAGGAGEI